MLVCGGVKCQDGETGGNKPDAELQWKVKARVQEDEDET